MGVTAIHWSYVHTAQLEPMFENMSESLLGILWLVPVVKIINPGTLGFFHEQNR
jgi:hypothetical protein